MRRIPLQAVPGNHEIECDESTRDVFVAYENYFRNPNRIAPADILPAPADSAYYSWTDETGKSHYSCTGPSEFLGHYNYGNAFYAFAHGLVHVIALNSYTDTAVGSKQYMWLEQALARVDRTVTPWLLVMFHCPLHTTFLGHNS